MKVLVVGSGGREYALAKKISESELKPEVHTAPGNAGTKRFGKNVPIKATDIKDLARYAKEEGMDLTVVGPEDPLCMGIADLFQKEGLMIFGPTARGARIEGSKYFSKTLMDSAGIRSANPWGAFCTPSTAKNYLQANWRPSQKYVVKADGLGAGKAVIVPDTLIEAYDAVDSMMVDRRFGSAGDMVVIERMFTGNLAQEGSAIILTDGETVLPLESSQDHKNVGEFVQFHDDGTPSVGHGDRGENTGGMGAYSPAPVLEAWGEAIVNRISLPLLAQLREENIIYRGIFYHGLWAENEGEMPQVVENNARGGDPEIQPLLRRLRSDILKYLMACAEGGGLSELPPLEWDERPCVGIVLASGGYPGSYAKGKLITGIEEADKLEGVHVFPAGIAEQDGRLYTTGGRVALVTALGEKKGDYIGAIDRAYSACALISFEGKYLRDDIGFKALGGRK